MSSQLKSYIRETQADRFFAMVLAFPDKDWNWSYLTSKATWRIIQSYHQFNWDYETLTWNSDIDLQKILDHPNHDWNWYYVCCEKDVDIATIRQYRSLPWNFRTLSGKFSWTEISENPDLPWDPDEVSYNKTITNQIIRDNPNFPWNYRILSHRQNFDWEYFFQHPDLDWDYHHLSSSPSLTWEMVQSHPDLNWDYFKMSINPNITWEIIEAHPDKFRDLSAIGRHPNLSKMIEQRPDFPWNFWNFFNYRMDPEIFLKHIDMLWDFIKIPAPIIRKKEVQEAIYQRFGHCKSLEDFLKMAPTEDQDLAREWADNLMLWFKNNYFISIELYLKYPDLAPKNILFCPIDEKGWDYVFQHPEVPWNYQALSVEVPWEVYQEHPEFPWVTSLITTSYQYVMDHPEFPWNYQRLSYAKDLTPEIVIKHPDWDWDFSELSRREWKNWKKNVALECIRKLIAIRKIKRWFVAFFWNPQSCLGYRRLQRSFHQDDYTVWSDTSR